MATCPKCGSGKARKRADGGYYCKSHGFVRWTLTKAAEMQMKFEVNSKSEIYTHVDHDTDVMRHFHVDAMREIAEQHGANVKGLECWRIEVIDEHVNHIKEKCGIEPHRIARLVPEFRDKPLIGVVWQDGKFNIIDGNHRYVKRHEDGFNWANCYVFTYPLWEQFLVNFTIEKDAMLDWMKTGFSGIGAAANASI